MFEIFAIITKWWKPILIVTIMAAILSVGYALMKPNKYKASTVFLPTNPNMVDKQIYSKIEIERPMWIFGGKGEMDRALALAKSKRMIDYAIDEFDLYKLYKVKPEEKKARLKVEEKFEKSYQVIRNSDNFIELSIIDKEPERSADMANNMRDKLDKMNNDFNLLKKRDILKTLENDVKTQQQQVKALRDSLTRINPTDSIGYKIVNSMLNSKLEDFNNTSTSYYQFKSIINDEYSSLYVVEEAQVPLKKDSPARSLLVIGSTLFAFLVMCLYAVLTEKYRQYREKEVLA